MCDPTTALVLSTAATLGGTAYNAQQNNAAISANQAAQEAQAARLSAARQAEAARQDDFQRRSAALTAGAQAAAQPTSMIGAENDAAAARERLLAPATESLMPGSATADPRLTGTATAANPAVVADGARELARALTQARTALKGQAFLSGAGDAGAGLGRTIAQTGSDLATTGLLRKSSLGAYDVERSQATPTYRAGDSLMGDLLVAGGALGSQYAGMQAGRAAAAARAGSAGPVTSGTPNVLTGRASGPI